MLQFCCNCTYNLYCFVNLCHLFVIEGAGSNALRPFCISWNLLASCHKPWKNCPWTLFTIGTACSKLQLFIRIHDCYLYFRFNLTISASSVYIDLIIIGCGLGVSYGSTCMWMDFFAWIFGYCLLHDVNQVMSATFFELCRHTAPILCPGKWLGFHIFYASQWTLWPN